MRILRVCHQLIHRYDDQNNRFEVLKFAIKKAKRSLYTVVGEVTVECQQHGKYHLKENPKPEEHRTINAEHLQKLERIACSKIEKWAKTNKLSKHKHLVSILFSWERWGRKEDIEQFIHGMISPDGGLINFITSFLSETRSHGISDYVERIEPRMDLKSIEHFVNLKEIEPRIRQIFSSLEYNGLKSEQKTAIKTFLDTYDGKIDNSF